MLTFVGEGGPRFESVFIPDRPAPHYGLIIVKAINYRVVEDYVEEIRIAAASRIAGARVVPHTYAFGEPIPQPISVRVHGTGFMDMGVMRSVAADVETVVRDSGRAWNVNNSWGEPGFQLEAVIDVDKANRSGVTNSDVARTLNAYLSGEYLTAFREGKRQIPVFFRLPPHQRESLREIGQMFVEGAQGKIPFDAIMSSELKRDTTVIQRYNMDRMIEVGARPYRGELAVPVLLEAIKPKLDEMERKLPAGIHLEYGGEIEKTNEALPMVGKSGIIGIAAIVVLLVLHYNSITKPWLILSMLPIALTGAVVGLYVFQEPMGFMAQLGVLLLFGIGVNDAIVLIEFVEMLNREKLAAGEGIPEAGQRRYSGLTKAAFRDCLVRGARMRITPIVLTSLTTVGGLCPLLFSGPMFRSLAAAVTCGLILTTFTTLLALPALMAIFVETLRIPLVTTDAHRS
jgi:multidrug efflux pump subunit AcrB